MRYEFTKMQSLGNDFIVFDGVSTALNITTDLAQRLAERHFGIGCDQLLVVERNPESALTTAADTDAEFLLRIFNRDGGEVEQCGNGARCIAKFLRDKRLSDRDTIGVRTHKQRMTLTLNADESVTVNMGVPEFSPPKIPFTAPMAAAVYALDVAGAEVEISAVAIGNPHAVLRVPRVADAPLTTHGAAIESHPRFAARANVGFMEVAARDRILLRVYERGVGETLGCGSGACAAVAVGVRRGWLQDEVQVALPGGEVSVRWGGEGQPIFLRGAVHTVFHGEVEW